MIFLRRNGHKPSIMIDRTSAWCGITLLFSCLLLGVSPFAYSQTTTAKVAGLDKAPAVIDEPYPLYEGLVRELRKGGYILFVRHAKVQPASKDTKSAGEWWKNCAGTQRTDASALPNAQAIGQALMQQRISISDVQSSEFCRAYDTAAFIGMSTPSRNPALNAFNAFESQKRPLADQAAGLITLLSQIPPTGRNRILVGHTLSPTIVHPLFAQVQEAHTLIFKPEGNGKFHFVASLSPGQWQWIGKQTVADILSTTTASAPQVVQPPITATPQPPMIDPAKEMHGATLLAALRRGGYNLYMRHAQATVGQDQDLLNVPRWWENCMIQRNLSDLGRDQAKKVGAAIRELKLPIKEVVVSQFCRVRETGTLMALGPVEVTEELNHAIGQRAGTDINVTRFGRLGVVPAKGSNTLLISHTHVSPRAEERIMGSIQEAEIVVYQPDAKGGAEPVARIMVPEWDNLLQVATKK
jgi:phosphohistidine phosphatase SixA